MLTELYIENLAVIEKSVITFGDKLNVFTGETGAGKSILINGINAILGLRVTKDIVRTGAKKAVISAVFNNISDDVSSMLSENGIDSDGELIISREISADGGSVARINSRPVNLSVLREIGELLVNVHGQHDSQILLSPQKHIEILDSYGNLESELEDYQKSFRELQAVAKQIKQVSLSRQNKIDRIQKLKEVVDEISSLDLKENEDEEVESEFALSNNAVEVRTAVNEVINLIEGDNGISNSLFSAYDFLESYSDVLSALEPLTERLKSAKIEIDDISAELNHMTSMLDVDPERFAYISARNDSIIRIKKKYGPSLSDVINRLDESVKELDILTGDDNNIEVLKARREELLEETSRKAKILSQKREQTGKRFIKEVTSELEFLNMPNVKLEISNTKGKLTIHGMDNIEFLISANLGEASKPIAKIASGGELSRIMLALKSVIAEKDNTPTMIFDEIDTGVSGRAAQKIGIKLHEISRMRQVICVTHLAQIAVSGDTHMLIEKKAENGKTKTSVCELKSLDERKREIARIISGDNISETTLASAEEMLKSINQI